MFFLSLSKIEFLSSEASTHKTYEKIIIQKFFKDMCYLQNKGNYYSFFFEDIVFYKNSKSTIPQSTFLQFMDTVILFERNKYKNFLKVLSMKSPYVVDYNREFLLEDFYQFEDIFHI